MSSSSRITQEQTLKQRQTLTPLQIQEVHILECTTLELEERVAREIEENLALEREENEEREQEQEREENNEEYGDDFAENDDDDLIVQEDKQDIDWEAYISDDDNADYGGGYTGGNSDRDEEQKDIPYSAGISFQEHLLTQVNELRLNELDKKIATYIVGNIDDTGYLRRDTQQISDDLIFRANIDISEEHVEEIIRTIQNTFDPVGVCARDLQECMIIQLKRKDYSPTVELAIDIVEKRFKQLSAHHYGKIMERLNISKEELQEVLTLIKHLNPYPGTAISNDIYAPSTIIPDFIVEAENGNLTVILNNGTVPELRVNREFNDYLQAYQKKEHHSRQEKAEATWIKDRIDSARWFINAIQQRNETMLRTMKAIVSIQREFFLEGDDSLIKPMVLKDIAERTGYDISTISRVSNSKYVETNGIILPLKFFFSEGIINEEGEEIATRAIKNELQQIIESEDKLAPLTDEKIAEILSQKGNAIARRTVAKYRREMNIPEARLRKEI